MHFENIIFDFDGVIVDSEPVHAAAKKLTLDHFEICYDEQLFDRFKGIPDADFFKHVSAALTNGAIPAADLHGLKKQHYTDLFSEVNLVEGVLTFVQQVSEKGVKIAIASSTTRRDFELVDEKYQLSRYFKVIITGDDTIRHKPHPEPYLAAIALLKTMAGLCIAIEDSPNGIKSALGAGCTVLGLTSSFSAEELKVAGATHIINSYDQVDGFYNDWQLRLKP